MAAAAAAFCGDSRGLSGKSGDYLPASGLLHSLVAGALNSKKVQVRRVALRARYFYVNFCESRRVRILKLGPSFEVQPESYERFRSRRRWSYGLDNTDKGGRRILAPLAAVATAAGDWESRWENSEESREAFWRIWNSESTSTGERLGVLGILALTGLVVARVLRGSSLLSVGAIILFLFLGGFHHRFKSALYFLSEKLQHLKGRFIRNARPTPISFKQQRSWIAAGNLLYSLSGSSLLLDAQTSSAVSGTSKRSKSIDVKDVACCVSLLTRIIQNRNSEVSADDVLRVNDLIHKCGITELREDMYRAASTLRGEESLLQSKLQSSVGFGQRNEEHRSHATVVQVPPAHKGVSTFAISSDNSGRRVTPSLSNWNGLERLDMKFSEVGGNVVNSDSSGSSDTQQGPQPSSISVPSRKEVLQAPTYQVITADYKLEPVTRFTPVALETQATAVTLWTIAASGVDGDRQNLRIATGSLQHSACTQEQIISEPLPAVETQEFTPDIAKQSSCSPVDSMDMKTGFQLRGQEIIIEDDFAPSVEAQRLSSLDEIVVQQATLAFECNEEDEQPMNMVVIDKASKDPWHDESRGSGLLMPENEDFHRETSVIQDLITPSSSGRWTDYDNDSAPYVKSVRKGVNRYGGGKGRANSKPCVDLWGNNTASAGRADRGALTRIKATGRGSLGSVDDVDNELPGRRRGGRKDEQMSREQARRRDSAEGAGQRTASGKQYVQNERELWDNESLIDEAVSSGRSTRRSTDDQETERDLDVRKAPASDREWSYGGRGLQNREIIDEEGDYRNGRNRDGRYYSQERTKSYKGQDDGQTLSEEEEAEDFRTREARDMEEQYFDNESSSWVGDDLGESQNGGNMGGNYSSQTRMSTSSRVPFNSRNRRQIAEEYDEEGDDEEDDGYRRDARTLEGEEQVRSNGRRSWAQSQNPGREELRGSDDDSDPEMSTDIPVYVQSEIEPEERNLPVRQPSRLQLEKFDSLLDEGEALLEEGMQGLEGRIEVGVAERMLYEAAKLFEAAAEIDPSSLVAVGFWGNTLLVHGELKLKLSQQLRSMLPSSNAYSMTRARAGAGWDDERESLELTLQNVCEECEELLVDAGRKYRMALSLDRTDMRALYNWGLALCYRGQLIADEGGERAIQDADKVYLAAVDKFEAMLGISQEYAPGALYNWGLAMRDRARLRPMGNRDRVKLLLQATELFQDAVRLDPNNGQARGAVTAVAAELEELKRFEEMQNEQGINGRPKRRWWE